MLFRKERRARGLVAPARQKAETPAHPSERQEETTVAKEKHPFFTERHCRERAPPMGNGILKECVLT